MQYILYGAGGLDRDSKSFFGFIVLRGGWAAILIVEVAEIGLGSRKSGSPAFNSRFESDWTTVWGSTIPTSTKSTILFIIIYYHNFNRRLFQINGPYKMY